MKKNQNDFPCVPGSEWSRQKLMTEMGPRIQDSENKSFVRSGYITAITY